MLNKIFLALLIGAISPVVNATVTLNFSDPGGVFAKGFANAAGTPTDGMYWGVVVDTSGNGFSAGSYNGFTLTPDVGSFLFAGGSATDDYFFPAMNSGSFFATLDSSIIDNVNGGVGTITTAPDVPFGGLTGISAGDSIALIWFDSNSAANGSKYGFLSGASFKLSAGLSDGGSEDLQALVPSGSRTASNTFQASLVPEPSRVMLFAFGGLGLLMRRRRV